jgi:predicted dehydrogenase
MKNKPIAPVLVGRGMAGQAILKSLSIASQTDSDLDLLPASIVKRGTPLSSYISNQAENVLFLANPSGLHASCIAEAEMAGFRTIVCDKPVAVRLEELARLEHIQARVNVLHGYRVLWGTQTIKQMIEAGELGEIFSIELRYWQSSSAQAALKGAPEKRSWKNDTQLNGPFDALVDLGSHAVDLCLFLMGDTPVESQCWLSYRNSAAAHRDTHVHLGMKFSGDRRALASISKTVHGASNHLEHTVLGVKGTATWRFEQPDEIQLGCGGRTSIIRREAANPSSGSLPFHGMGWLEGYVEIVRQSLRQAAGLSSTPVPTLKESLEVMKVLLNPNAYLR